MTRARSLLDTGSTLTAVAPWVLKKLGLSSKGQGTSHTAGGQVPVALYHVSLTLLPADQSGAGITLPSVWISELLVTLPDADVLVGLNVLLQLEMILRGPAQLLTLAD